MQTLFIPSPLAELNSRLQETTVNTLSKGMVTSK